jgi:cytoskeletal protein CcmA (bactofilin family)
MGSALESEPSARQAVIHDTRTQLGPDEGLGLKWGEQSARVEREEGEMAFGRRTKQTRVEIDDARHESQRTPTETFLDAGSVLTGELRFAENVRLEGRVEGKIHAGKTVFVGEHAEIDASIEADTLEVYGTIVGDIRVARRTILHKTARVEGEIQTAGIVVEEGARFKGCIVIGAENATPGLSVGLPDVPPLAAVRAESMGAWKPES